MHTHNSIWQFFASVKLALVTISLLAVTSIIGTVIPQNKPVDFYVTEYGPEMSRLFMVLDIPNMYQSWWFLGLLFLLACNLSICSVERFPGAWKQITADGLKWSEERLAKMPNHASWDVPSPPAEVIGKLTAILSGTGWKPAIAKTEQRTVLFSQKGAWSRTGVYIVHSSILIIFLGGILGTVFGFKGNMVIPESMERDKIALFDKQEFKELGFTVRCNSFSVDFYANGAPKEFVSNLTILENGRTVLTRDIQVNHPLTYRGITFYQASYQAFNDFVVTIGETGANGERQSFVVPFQKQEQWPEENLVFGIINAKTSGQTVVSSKIWISDGTNPPVTQWLETNVSMPVRIGDREIQVAVKQLYATGLQVSKDPGVWLVYIGCLLMLFGLAVAFFMSHRRLWVQVTDSGQGATILLAGSANKNRPGFARTFEQLESSLRKQNVQEY